MNALKELSPDIPIISEESKRIPYEARKRWTLFWLVDPLDGTKEFIKRNGEFTVNIALIEKDTPVLGVIYVPVKKLLYFASKGQGAYKVDCVRDVNDQNNFNELITKGLRLPLECTKGVFTIIGSRSHMSKETEQYVDTMKHKYGRVDMISAGSSLKLCMVAEGQVDVYPRFASTMEWDTAAGHVIAEEAGAKVVNAKTKERLKYNKKELLNPWFLVERKVL